jgi:heptosyltransferase-2
VGNYLGERYGLSVGVFGASDERDVVKAVAGGIVGGKAFLGVPPRVLFEIFRRCAIITTNDTGPMHIAAAAGRPGIVAIFGPEDPNRYAPYRAQGSAVVVFEKVDCSPCTLYMCDNMECLKGITVDRVTDAVDLLMETRGRARAR